MIASDRHAPLLTPPPSSPLTTTATAYRYCHLHRYRPPPLSPPTVTATISYRYFRCYHHGRRQAQLPLPPPMPSALDTACWHRHFPPSPFAAAYRLPSPFTATATATSRHRHPYSSLPANLLRRQLASFDHFRGFQQRHSRNSKQKLYIHDGKDNWQKLN